MNVYLIIHVDMVDSVLTSLEVSYISSSLSIWRGDNSQFWYCRASVSRRFKKTSIM